MKLYTQLSCGLSFRSKLFQLNVNFLKLYVFLQTAYMIYYLQDMVLA